MDTIRLLSVFLVTALQGLAVPERIQAQAIVPASAPHGTSVSPAGNSYAPFFSGNGRFIAFVSHAGNLVTNQDLGPYLNLFVRDLVSSNTVLVSVSTNGFSGANDSVALYSVSTNGQFVAFETLANNLAPGDTNRRADIYVRDTASGTTRWVSFNAEGTGNVNAACSNPLISEDGRYVVFESAASNLVTNDFNGTNDIFIYDLLAGTTELVSVNAEGSASPEGASHSPTISADGLTVAFVSHATNLVEGVTNTLGEVYARNILAGTTRWAVASHIPWATRQNYYLPTPWRVSTGVPIGGVAQPSVPYVASGPVLSADGRYVAFKTLKSTVRFDLTLPTNQVVSVHPTESVYETNYFSFLENPRVGIDCADTPLAFTRDGRFLTVNNTNKNARAPVGIGLTDFETIVAVVSHPFFSPNDPFHDHVTNMVPLDTVVLTNGRPSSVLAWTNLTWLHLNRANSQLLFLADATNLVSGVTNRSYQIYSVDWPDQTVRLLSTNLAGQPGPDLSSVRPSASPNGSLLAWDSPDENVVAGDANGSWDVFLQNLESGERSLVSAREPGFAMTARGLARLTPGSLSANGRRVAVLSYDGSLAPHDTNNQTDLFVRDLANQSTQPLTLPRLPQPGPLTRYLRPVAPVLSADGRRIAFAGLGDSSTTATNLTLYWRDTTAPTNRVIVSSASFNYASTTLSFPSLSADGLSVAFHSDEPMAQSVSDWSSINHDIFVYEIPLPGETFRNPQLISTSSISTGPFSVSSANAASINPVFSPDGAWVVFQSKASDLTSDFTTIQGVYQLFARQRFVNETNLLPSSPRYVYGPTRLISYNTAASLAPSGSSTQSPLPGGASTPVFSADSRYLAFQGWGDRIYRHDLTQPAIVTVTSELQAGSTTYFTNRANLTNDLICTNCGNPSLSGDGNVVAYETRYPVGASNNVFAKNLVNGQVELVSVAMNGLSANGNSFTPLMSHDARYVVFASKASNLVAGDDNQATDIFVRDRLAGVTHCLSRSASGTGTGNRVSSHPVLSGDGRTVAFQSFASDLITGDYNDTRDVFVVTLAGPDTDADQMDDDWEMAYFSTLQRDGAADFDGDGVNDQMEFRAGTNPSSDASVLRVLAISTSVLAPDTMNRRQTVLLWSAVPGKTYRVQFKETFDKNPWIDLPGDVVPGGTTATKVHEGFWLPERVFYRVVLVQ